MNNTVIFYGRKFEKLNELWVNRTNVISLMYHVSKLETFESSLFSMKFVRTLRVKNPKGQLWRKTLCVCLCERERKKERRKSGKLRDWIIGTAAKYGIILHFDLTPRKKTRNIQSDVLWISSGDYSILILIINVVLTFVFNARVACVPQ